MVIDAFGSIDLLRFFHCSIWYLIGWKSQQPIEKYILPYVCIRHYGIHDLPRRQELPEARARTPVGLERPYGNEFLNRLVTRKPLRSLQRGTYRQLFKSALKEVHILTIGGWNRSFQFQLRGHLIISMTTYFPYSMAPFDCFTDKGWSFVFRGSTESTSSPLFSCFDNQSHLFEADEKRQ